jgi:hypothetical protein
MIPRRMVPRGQVPRRMVPRGQVPKIMVPRRMGPRRMVPRRMVPRRMVPRRQVPRRVIPRGQVPRGTALIHKQLFKHYKPKDYIKDYLKTKYKIKLKKIPTNLSIHVDVFKYLYNIHTGIYNEIYKGINKGKIFSLNQISNHFNVNNFFLKDHKIYAEKNNILTDIKNYVNILSTKSFDKLINEIHIKYKSLKTVTDNIVCIFIGNIELGIPLLKKILYSNKKKLTTVVIINQSSSFYKIKPFINKFTSKIVFISKEYGNDIIPSLQAINYMLNKYNNIENIYKFHTKSSTNWTNKLTNYLLNNKLVANNNCNCIGHPHYYVDLKNDKFCKTIVSKNKYIIDKTNFIGGTIFYANRLVYEKVINFMKKDYLQYFTNNMHDRNILSIDNSPIHLLERLFGIIRLKNPIDKYTLSLIYNHSIIEEEVINIIENINSKIIFGYYFNIENVLLLENIVSLVKAFQDISHLDTNKVLILIIKPINYEYKTDKNNKYIQEILNISNISNNIYVLNKEISELDLYKLYTYFDYYISPQCDGFDIGIYDNKKIGNNIITTYYSSEFNKNDMITIDYENFKIDKITDHPIYEGLTNFESGYIKSDNIINILLHNTHIKNKLDLLLNKKINHNCAILLTSCIRKTVYNDTDKKMDYYLQSFNSWLKKTTLPIFVVESSGYTFPEFNHTRLNICTTNINEKYESAGQYETRSILYATNHFKNELKNYKYMMKITGRYFINCENILDTLEDVDLAIQYKRSHTLKYENCEIFRFRLGIESDFFSKVINEGTLERALYYYIKTHNFIRLPSFENINMVKRGHKSIQPVHPRLIINPL